ncbi:hypothetical protein Ahy_B10g100687 [Arachis hypogaea]|uniref:Uncharacterized protein n=1 Tax=Arachis hypogaea TaxID=3818 RepID=A0A444WXG0_ARAHY|nr:hypothetical protein Ahy_B10g100687 [Arachis hypogaea]
MLGLLAPYNNQFPIFQPQNQNSQTPHFSFSSIFNPSIENVTPTSLPFPTQFNTSRHNSSGVGDSSNPSSHTPIQSSPTSQYSDFANILGACIILHNMIVEDERDTYAGNFAQDLEYDDVKNGLSQPQLGEDFVPYHQFLQRNAQFRNKQ